MVFSGANEMFRGRLVALGSSAAGSAGSADPADSAGSAACAGSPGSAGPAGSTRHGRQVLPATPTESLSLGHRLWIFAYHQMMAAVLPRGASKGRGTSPLDRPLPHPRLAKDRGALWDVPGSQHTRMLGPDAASKMTKGVRLVRRSA
jgi:hypothetical protein